MTTLLLAACLLGAPGERPNVLLIVSDDQAWDDYGFLGSPHAHTPHLDRLAGESLLFPRGYVPTSLCRPSLASILTGQYPHAHGITGNDPADPGRRGAMNRALADDPTLPALLKGAGYRTLQTGKWWEGDPRDHGLHRRDDARRPGPRRPARGRGADDRPRRRPEPGPRPDPGVPRCRGGVRGAVVRLVRPFLPHTPHDPPARLRRKYDARVAAGELTPREARYFANVERFDEAVGAVRAEVDRRGPRDTLIVYVCDNGWITSPERSAYAPRSKRSPHEGGVRTPILLRRPGAIEPRRDGTPVSSVDLARTILAACDLPVPAEAGGVNLLDPAAVADRGPVFGEVFEHDQPDRLIDGLRDRWVVAGDWKLILPFARSSEGKGEPVPLAELYDLAADPHETRDLAGTNPERVARLTGLLDDWWDPSSKPGDRGPPALDDDD